MYILQIFCSRTYIEQCRARLHREILDLLARILFTKECESFLQSPWPIKKNRSGGWRETLRKSQASAANPNRTSFLLIRTETAAVTPEPVSVHTIATEKNRERKREREREREREKLLVKRRTVCSVVTNEFATSSSCSTTPFDPSSFEVTRRVRTRGGGTRIYQRATQQPVSLSYPLSLWLTND